VRSLWKEEDPVMLGGVAEELPQGLGVGVVLRLACLCRRTTLVLSLLLSWVIVGPRPPPVARLEGEVVVPGYGQPQRRVDGTQHR